MLKKNLGQKIIYSREWFPVKQNKYTMDPVREIYLSNNQKNFVKNDFKNQNQKKNQGTEF